MNMHTARPSTDERGERWEWREKKRQPFTAHNSCFPHFFSLASNAFQIGYRFHFILSVHKLIFIPVWLVQTESRISVNKKSFASSTIFFAWFFGKRSQIFSGFSCNELRNIILIRWVFRTVFSSIDLRIRQWSLAIDVHIPEQSQVHLADSFRIENSIILHTYQTITQFADLPNRRQFAACVCSFVLFL